MMKASARASAPPGAGVGAGAGSGRRLPLLEDFLSVGDFTGAVTLLEFQMRAGAEGEVSKLTAATPVQTLAWLAWAAFHKGDYKRALAAYSQLAEGAKPSELEGIAGVSGVGAINLQRACCFYALGEYEAADAAAATAPDSPLKHRLLLHMYYEMGDESKVVAVHGKLSSDRKDDLLCLAALHYSRGHYQDSADAFKRILANNRDDVAINVFIALCYYRLDYYDVSLETLAVYLQAHPTSPFALNLKACNHFKLYNGKAAESELRALSDQGVNLIETDSTLRHNLVVFRGGEGALGILPGLMGDLPEARLNLAIYHLKGGRLVDAAALLRDIEPSTVPEFILKATIAASLAQAQITGVKLISGGGAAGATGVGGASSATTQTLMKGMTPREALKSAQQLYHLVGASPTECDTIPGRQAMAACFFLLRQFDDVNVYLASIKPYMYAEDEFNWNAGVAAAAVGRYKEAEEALLLVQSPAMTSDHNYVAWLARCHVFNKRARAAWDLYLTRSESGSGPAALSLLREIAGDCYSTGQFFYAAKAYDVLEKLDPGDSDVVAGKLGACAGVLQAVAAGGELRESLREVLSMLRASASGPQGAHAELLARAIQRWAGANRDT